MHSNYKFILYLSIQDDFIDAVRYYDYDENEKSRHPQDERKLWRKKALQDDHKDWGDERSIRRHEYDRYGPEDMDPIPQYRHDIERGPEYQIDKEIDRLKPALYVLILSITSILRSRLRNNLKFVEV